MRRFLYGMVVWGSAAGNPWSWRGFYWDHEPQTEVGRQRHDVTMDGLR
jgi:hypothetical protein